MISVGNFDQVFIIFIFEKGCSTEVVPTGRVRHTFARVLKLGHKFGQFCQPGSCASHFTNPG